MRLHVLSINVLIVSIRKRLIVLNKSQSRLKLWLLVLVENEHVGCYRDEKSLRSTPESYTEMMA